MISRRKLVGALTGLPFTAAHANTASTVKVTLNTDTILRSIPADYMGLGFEISSVAVPNLLTAKNKTYVQLVRNLGKKGVIRVGGNTSDFATFDAHGAALSAPKSTVVNESNLRDLKTFLDALDWTLIWGLNLGQDRLDNAVSEAKAVAQVMGDRLLALEIGNEPDLFPRSGHRSADYGYAAWFADYRRYKAAIRAILPRVPFAGPDLAGATDWMEQFARDEHDIQLLTAHHYIAGQSSPTATIETMLAANTRYNSILDRFKSAAEGAHIPWRMCETASFSGGGKDGVSDSAAAALWSLDYLFVLAEFGCAGVNMETGVNHLGWISHYTPISDDLQGHYSAAPEYYGLLAFSLAGRGDLIKTSCEANGVNLTAYATRDRGRTCVTIINKDNHRDAIVTVDGATADRAEAMRLTMPSVSATTGLKLGGHSVDSAGLWKSGTPDIVELKALPVRAGSAVLLWFSS